MATTERDVLDALHEVVQAADVYGSHDQGKNFYNPMSLPARLGEYLSAANLSVPTAARRFKMSPGTLRRILAGGPLSENMLFRIRGAMEYASQHPGLSLQKEGDTYPGDWRGTSKESVQHAIAIVTEKLIYLKDAIIESNSLAGGSSPIDPVQIAQLIALLDATLHAVRAPYLEANQTSGFFKWLKRVLKTGVEKGLEGRISDALGQAVDAGGNLIDALGNSSGPSDLGGIIT
jgi:hypothetical protein